MFREEFNTKKLELYLNASARGFILLQVNDKRYERALIDLIASVRTIIAFDLEKSDFRDGIEYLKMNKDVQLLLYYNLHSNNEELKKILEKINLSRDLLLAQERMVVFIVPQYAAFMIQDEFPNLYSYFTLKEEYIKEYPLLFEYIFPDKKYLITKDSQSESKKFFYSSEAGVEERLDYYMQKKVKKRELTRLKKDFNEYLEGFQLNTDTYDWRYYYTLLLRMAKVCTVQGDYKYAVGLYDKILMAHIVISQYQGIYYEACLQKADILLKQGKYNDVIETYKAVIIMISRQQDYGIADVFLEYVVKIYPRIAICYAKLEQYSAAGAFMYAALKWAEEREDYAECFSITYNQIILDLHMGNVKDSEMYSRFEDLKKLVSCDVQKSIYLSIYAWYQGVIGGQCSQALEYAYDALALKRESFTENNVRIAESHYLISILYLLSDDIEHAEACGKKCVNILSNHKLEKEKTDVILKVYENK